MLEWLGLPVAGLAHAAEVDHIMVLVHWLMLVLFVGWGSYFLWALVRKGISQRAEEAEPLLARIRSAQPIAEAIATMLDARPWQLRVLREACRYPRSDKLFRLPVGHGHGCLVGLELGTGGLGAEVAEREPAGLVCSLGGELEVGSQVHPGKIAPCRAPRA